MRPGERREPVQFSVWLLGLALVGGGAQAADFDALDVDGDGRLSFQEALDRNGDGIVSLDEVNRGHDLLRWWQAADRNRDGYLDRTEFSVFELSEIP